MMCYKKIGLAFWILLLLGVIALSGCISPEDPFSGYNEELLDHPDHLVRVATYYDPEFTEPGYRESVEAYGLERGHPANVGRGASIQIWVGNEKSDKIDGGNQTEEMEENGPSCKNVSPGTLLKVPRAGESPNYYCVTLDEDRHARTHFFLPESTAAIVDFRIGGLASESAGKSIEDCRAPSYRAERPNSIEPIPGKLLIDEDRDILLHFGIRCL